MTAPHVAAIARELIYQTADLPVLAGVQLDEVGRAAYTRVALNHLEEQVPDPELRQKLVSRLPDRLQAGAHHRRLLSGADAANVRWDRSDRAHHARRDRHGRAARRTEFDVIVYATGFETTGWHWSMDVRGGTVCTCATHGRRYRTPISASRSTASRTSSSSTARTRTSATTRSRSCSSGRSSTRSARSRRCESAAPRRSTVTRRAQDRFNRELQAALAKTTWADPDCRSWYKTADGRITQNWSSHTRDYAAATAEVRIEDYEFRSA